MDDRVNVILDERQKTHGNYFDHALVTQSLKEVMRTQGVNYYILSPDKAEALEMIQHKIGRILAGDPSHIDHWDDIAGYATLVATELRKQDNAI